jgi:hypothetical protein
LLRGNGAGIGWRTTVTANRGKAKPGLVGNADILRLFRVPGRGRRRRVNAERRGNKHDVTATGAERKGDRDWGIWFTLMEARQAPESRPQCRADRSPSRAMPVKCAALALGRSWF